MTLLLADLSLGAPRWLGGAIGLAVLAALVVLWSYTRSAAPGWVRGTCALLKAAGIVALATCLVEPLYTGVRPRPGSNLFLVAADNSRSLQLADKGQSTSRGKVMQDRLNEKSPWLTRLSQDFDVRRYAFDSTLHPLTDFTGVALDGNASALSGAMHGMSERFRGRSVAGMLVFTDGNATDLFDDKASWKGLPPVYPVILGEKAGALDLSVTRVTVSQTNFEAAPVTLAAEIAGQLIGSNKFVVRILDELGKEIERRQVASIADGETLVERFLIRPEKPGVNFYTVHAALEGEEQLPPEGKSREATLANNRRIAVVDRGRGPYRVLYVGGRPSWEFKFLRRALAEDEEVSLVGLVRVAKKEPRFQFHAQGDKSNPLFRGFDKDDETAEQYNEPVLIRLGTENQTELKGGFPKSTEDLFSYHAVILDDVEAEFFTKDQQSLLQQFVSRRGGGFLMLGGKDSFAEGKYQRTPIGEFLPVYLDRMPPSANPAGYKLKLTREGWLQPWVRMRANEPDEDQRLAAMPPFKSINQIQAIKPGASVLSQIETSDGTLLPALVVQQFGRGRAGAMMIADLWRWGLKRPDPAESDLEKSWRQTVRWLVSDVPMPVDVEARLVSGNGPPSIHVTVRTHDKQFDPLDNATVNVKVQLPDKREVEVVAEASGQKPGEYQTVFIPRDPGVYLAMVTVAAADGSEVGQRETGWAVEPDTEEFKTLQPNRALLERIAKETGGEVLTPAGLEQFVTSLPNRKIPVVETWTYPLWHQWPLFAVAIACLAGEWGLRRLRGLP